MGFGQFFRFARQFNLIGGLLHADGADAAGGSFDGMGLGADGVRVVILQGGSQVFDESRGISEKDLDDYQVVRVADEIVVDLMKSACGVTYAEASENIEWANIEGVSIPFAGAKLLWKLKQAPRAKDEIDRSFLRTLLGINDS